MNPFYRTIRMIFRPILFLWNRMEVIGLENLPARGPAILVANHHSYMDSFVLGSACPLKIRFMVKSEQFYKWFMRWFYWGMDAFPVHQGGNDRAALRTSMAVLESGGLLGIFPGGSRASRPETAPWMEGIGVIARRSGAPVVPVALQGTYRAMPRGALFPWPVKVRVVFGGPVEFPDRRGRRAVTDFVEALRGRVDGMLETGEPVLGPLRVPQASEAGPA